MWNFDTCGRASMTLFEVASLDAWVDVMYRAMDITGETTAPRQDANAGAALFFVLFIPHFLNKLVWNQVILGPTVLVSVFTWTHMLTPRFGTVGERWDMARDKIK